MEKINIANWSHCQLYSDPSPTVSVLCPNIRLSTQLDNLGTQVLKISTPFQNTKYLLLAFSKQVITHF